MSSGFITESELAEAKKKRQEEWEKVRKADDPLERPEEPYDSRSLYDRLQEQKQKKDLEYEEAHKLKNMIKGLDDDEIEFLDLVDRTKLAADRKKTLEEELELNDYRNRVANLQEKALEEKLQVTITKPKVVSGTKLSQTKLLLGAVVTKNEAKKRKHSESNYCTEDNHLSEDGKKKNLKVLLDENKTSSKVHESAFKCIGILPGLGHYNDSSSDRSSDSEPEVVAPKIDLLGRKIQTKKDDD